MDFLKRVVGSLSFGLGNFGLIGGRGKKNHRKNGLNASGGGRSLVVGSDDRGSADSIITEEVITTSGDVGRSGELKLLTLGLELIAGLFVTLFAIKMVDPYRHEREEARKKAAELKKRLGRSIPLNEYEQLIAANVVNPSRIPISVSDVYGLDAVIDDLRLKVIAPLKDPGLYSTTLWKPTRGVLLYGPPGTGKTLVAKALAQSSGCFFVNVTASTILSKWYGDANRLVRAIFTLAWKLEPCIIFVDEVDALLSSRGSATEHEATLSAKTEFMALWEGMETLARCKVLVMGATNRRDALDPAVLRRFSIQVPFAAPDKTQREKILKGYLCKHDTEIRSIIKRGGLRESCGGVDNGLLNGTQKEEGISVLSWLAEKTVGYSGSDLYELCAQASQVVLREYHKRQQFGKGQIRLRPLNVGDFKEVLKTYRRPTAFEHDEISTANIFA